jgi:hypothetical protein
MESSGQLRRGIGKCCKADVVIVPIDPSNVTIRRAQSLSRTQDDVVGEAVTYVPCADIEVR